MKKGTAETAVMELPANKRLLKETKLDIRRLGRELARLQKLEEKLEHLVRLAGRANTIYDGVFVCVDGRDVDGLDGPQEKRSARIYQNANNNKRYGVELVERDKWPFASENVGIWYKKGQAMKLACEWVVHGKRPPHNERMYPPR